MDKRHDEIFEQFLIHYPNYGGHVVKWIPDGKFTILVKTDDGDTIQFNQIYSTRRFINDWDGSNREWRKEFAERLREKMWENRIDQVLLSELTGLSQQSVSAYIHGTRIPTGIALTKIAGALRCSTDYLINFNESRELK